MISRALLLLFLLITQLSKAQNFESHIWQDRLVVMFADTPENETLITQYKELIRFQKGLKERKLILYLIIPLDKLCTLNHVKCLSNSAAYQRLKKFNSSFELMLIGLDGGTKLRRKSVLTSRELFDFIDTMPMRAQELRKN